MGRRQGRHRWPVILQLQPTKLSIVKLLFFIPASRLSVRPVYSGFAWILDQEGFH
jgi:hypothetical protein